VIGRNDVVQPSTNALKPPSAVIYDACCFKPIDPDKQIG